MKDVNLERIAEITSGYSGAELAALCNESALAALEESALSDVVTTEHFEKGLRTVKPRIQKDLLRIYDEFHKNNDKS